MIKELKKEEYSSVDCFWFVVQSGETEDGIWRDYTGYLSRVNTHNALVMPYINYCSAVWGNIIKGLADKLQLKIQNRATSILTFSYYEVRSSALLDELGWEG